MQKCSNIAMLTQEFHKAVCIYKYLFTTFTRYVITEWYNNNLIVVKSSKSSAMIVTTRQTELLCNSGDEGLDIDLVLNNDYLNYFIL